jgi:DNA polymerase-3 subunit epsilon
MNMLNHWWEKLRAPDKDLPDFAREYLENIRQHFRADMAVDSLRFVVLDTETSGLDPQKSSMLSFGGVVVQHNRIRVQDSLELTATAPDAQLDEDVAVHGILKSEIKSGLPDKEIIRQVVRLLDKSVIVAHHAAFDLAILNKLTKKHYGFKLKNPVLDTAYLAKRLEHGTALNEYIRPEEYSLDKLCDRYRILTEDRHTAAGDALITAELLLKLLNKAKKLGIRTYGELIR